MLIFVGSLLWWQQDAAGGNKNGGSKKNRQKSGYFSFWKFHEYIKGEHWEGIKIQIWLFEKLAAWIPVGFETRVNDGTC